MLPIALILIFFAVALLLLALRGRIAERGVFCRACAFDLAGIDLHAADPRCPECGRAIAPGKPPRPVRRARSKLMGAVAGILLLIAVVLAGISICGNAPAVYKHMPDRVVVYAAIWGSDPALDELLTRSGLTPPMSDGMLQTAIENGLALQADESVAWDTRWGELLFNAAIYERMSEDQFARYIMSLDEFTFMLRDRVRAGTPRTTVLVKAITDRGNALTGGQLAVQRTLRLTHAGIAGYEEQLIPNQAGIEMPFPVSPKKRRISKRF